MSFSLKHILIFIISSLLFAGAVYLVNTELMDIVQAQFYNPSIINSIINENTKDAQLIQSHISKLQLSFASSLGETAVRNSFLHNQKAEDIFERSRIFGILMESTAGLQSVQFVDSNGVRIHYSTSSRDVLSQTRDSTSYRNYNENPYVLPFEMVSVPIDGGSKFLMDEVNDRIIFSYPFRDSMDVFKGTAIYTVSIRALAEILITDGSLSASDTVSLIAAPPGIVFGTPDTSKAEILGKVASIWNNGLQDNVTLDAEDSGIEFALISTKTIQGIYLGRLVNNSLFTIPEYMKIILLLSMFLTFYLTAAFLASLKPDPVILVRNRIKKLKNNLFERIENEKNDQDREKFVFELEQRRDEIHRELKQKLKISRGKEKRIDALIDRSWNELLAEIKGADDYAAPGKYPKEEPAQQAKKDLKPGKPPEEIEEIEEIGEVEEAEEIDEAEEVEEIGEAEEIEEIGEAEEIEEIDEIEEVEEIEEIDEVEELEEIGEVEDIEEIDEIEEAEELEEIEEIDEAEELEEIEEIEEAGEAGKIDEIEEIKDIDEIEDIEEIEDIDVLEEIGEIEVLDETEEIEETEEVKPKEATPIVLIIPKNIKKEEEETKANESASVDPTDHEQMEQTSPIEFKEPAIPAKAHGGLLERAQTIDSQVHEPTVDEPTVRGLLAKAEQAETAAHNEPLARGLLAIAEEIEFNQDIPAGKDEAAEDLIPEVEIVSPFASMFTSLDE